MNWRGLGKIFAPGGAALLTGGVTELIVGAPAATLLAAGVGAVAASLAFSRTEDVVPSRALAAGPRAQPAGRPDMPLGLGRALLAHLPMGIVLVDRDGQIAFMNDAAAGLFGKAPESGLPASSLRAPKLLDAIDASLSEGLSGTVHFNLARSGGLSLHLRAHVRRLGAEDLFHEGLRAPAAPAALVVIEDETRGFRAEELHRDFVANASHELKTPLASISAIIETLQGHARHDPDAAERFIGMLGHQAERMKRLVADLLSLNRIEVNERVRPSDPQDLIHILLDMVEFLTPLGAEAGIAVVADLPEDQDVTVLGSREELSQLFQNLIENAIKYGREGGSVRVDWLGHREDRPGMVGVCVVDDGPGIAREHLPRLTERFYRVSVSRSRERGGTGLGLAICKHVVNRHRGRLEIDSELGKGSRFTVWLPEADAPDGAPGNAVAAASGKEARATASGGAEARTRVENDL